jgi:hypothetical protein
MGKEIHKKHTFMVPKAAVIFFFLTDDVALNFFAGREGGCFHIMEALLISNVA